MIGNRKRSGIKMMNKFRQFMVGRYGIDTLNIALVVTGCVLTFMLSFIRTPYYRLIGFLPYAFMIFRAVSKNFTARAKENEMFLKYFTPVAEFIKKKYRQYQDKEHKYYKCPTCKRVLRVPSGRGKIEISCPYCRTKFKKNTGKPKVTVQ